MLRYFRICLLGFLLCIANFCFAQTYDLENGKRLAYEAYAFNSPAKWEQGIKILTQLHRASHEDLSILYALACAEYGYIGYFISKEKEKEAKEWIEILDGHIEAMLSINENWAEAHALKGGLYGLKIGLSPAKSIYLGPRSLSALQKALNQGANVPIAWVENANAKFHSPPLVGGSNEKAIEYFSKAIELFDKQAGKKKNNWMYLHSLAWLGQAYEKAGNLSKARATYEKALVFEPNFHWVSKDLLPKIN